ncbi:MAG: hypothetical protein KDK36_12085 [Leptospiraceae bacterium]|nr:hypothetical protein [Leptospiraceae bacterium]
MQNEFSRISTGTNPDELINNTNFEKGAFVIVFFGDDFDYKKLYESLKSKKIPFIGCMDTGRLFSNEYKLDSSSASLMVLTDKIIDKVKLISYDMRKDISYSSLKSSSKELFSNAIQSLGIDASNPDMESTFCINILHGLQSANPILEGQAEVSMYLQTVGGSSGGKLDFKLAPVISSQGLGSIGTTAIIKLKDGFYFRTDLSTSFQKIDGNLKVTGLKSPRHITAFNGNPAEEEYARALNISTSELTPETFATYTLGLETGDGERLITSIQQPDGNGGFLTYNDVVEGVNFSIYKSISQEQFRKDKIQSYLTDEPVAYISFDCVLCYLARNSHNEVQKIADIYNEVLPNTPKIGFGTFSENFCGANVNQTESFLMLLKRG